jgi:hypothetical protein
MSICTLELGYPPDLVCLVILSWSRMQHGPVRSAGCQDARKTKKRV